MSVRASEFGYREITEENWSEPDPLTAKFGPRGRDKSAHPHIKALLGPALNERVPVEVRKLFEVARGVMVYAYYFYPLYTIGLEQLFRVSETAITRRCQCAGHSKRPRFAAGIDYLLAAGVFSSADARRWHALRSLRNSASHLDRQTIWSPGSAIGILQRLAVDINALWT